MPERGGAVKSATGAAAEAIPTKKSIQTNNGNEDPK